jgi:hypothetical protein
VSAIADVRKLLIAGDFTAITAQLLAAAVVELADRDDALERAVFPPEPPANSPAAVAAEPITVDKPQLSGSVDAVVGSV